MDFIYLGVIILFFLSSWGLMKACDVLQETKSGDHT